MFKSSTISGPVAVAGLAIMLALGACSSGGDAPPDYTLSDARMGVTVQAGTHTISGDLADAFSEDDAGLAGREHPTGTIVSAGGLDFACVDGPCSVAVAPDGSHITTTGTIEVVMMGGDFPTAMRPPVEPEPTPYEMAKANIAAAETAADAQAAYDEVKDDVTAAQGDLLQAAVDARIMVIEAAEREATQKMELADAAGMIDTSDLSTAELIAAANTAIDGLRQALADADDVSDADKATYQTQLSNAEMAVREAQTGLDTAGRMAAQRTAITNAVTMARTAVNGVKNTSTDTEVGAADQAITALEAAIAGAADLPEGDSDVASARGTLTTLMAQLNTAKTARTAYLATKAEEDTKAMAALGKAMHAALGGTPTANTTALNNLDLTTAPEIDLSDGLSVDAVQGAGRLHDTEAVGDPASVTLKAGAAAEELGSWMGKNYAHTNTGTKVVNEALVYTNQGAPDTKAFGDVYEVAEANAGAAPAFTAIKGSLTVDGTDAAVRARVTGAAFTHSGTQTHTIDSNTGIFTTRGYYDGAPGQYRCTGACSSANDGKGSPSALVGTWHFKPDSGAMVSQPDANYLYYGWWVSKDKDGMPTAASAFTGVNGAIAALTDDPVSAVEGSATYSGNAAGKFAMSNALDGTGDAGHFTATVELTAKFGSNDAPNNGGVSGTINDFMANGESVPWSVALHRAPWGTAGAFTSTSSAGTTADGTTWSIDGNAAPESGTWSGQMYDEKPGDPPNRRRQQRPDHCHREVLLRVQHHWPHGRCLRRGQAVGRI